MKRKARLILNPTAAAGADSKARLRAFVHALESDGWQVDVCRTQQPGHGLSLAESSLALGLDAVLAAGGDGTVREVVSGLLRTGNRGEQGCPVPVGILPWGTGNDVAHLTGVRSDEDLRAALAAGQLATWDTLEVMFRTETGDWETQHALLFAACGFAGDLLRQTTPRVKRVFGRHLAYPVGFLRGLTRFRPFRMQVQSGGRRWEGDWVVALAANAPVAGGGTMRIAPGAKLHDGRIRISLIQAVSRWELLRQFSRFVRGTHIDHPRVEYFAGTDLEVAAEPAEPVAMDGDLIGWSPMRVRVVPRSIQFYCHRPEKLQR